MRRTLRLAFAFAAIWPLTAADLAPTGTLRATFLGSNPVQGRVDPKTGAVSGPIADLVAELAKQLGVPFTITPAPNAAGVIEKIKNHSADVGFLAYDEPRAAEVDFAGPFELMYNTYVVAAASPIKTSTQVDQAGLIVGAVKGQTQEIFLSGSLKNAKLRAFAAMPPQGELERLLSSGELAAFGLNRQRAEDAAVSAKLRALADNFLVVEQEFVVEKGSPAKVEYLNRFVDGLRDSGFLKAAIEKAGLSGVGVAPRHAK
jgi:polar amino acid transport system substrate-binding protein